jgi:hypothetical protein
MSQEPEQIGELSYLPHPDYPYPFPVERPPHYWMTEQTGRLAEAIESYLNGDKLSAESLDLIKQYLTQYVERALMTGEADRRALLRRAGGLRSQREIERFAEELAEYGIEPL